MQPFPFLRIRQIVFMGAPLILLQIIYQPCFQWISMDGDKFKRIAVQFNNYGFLSPPEKPAITRVPFVVTLRINPIQMPHGSGKICIRGLDQEMIMGRHKTISRDLNLENLVKFLKKINKRPIVFLCCEDFFPTPTTIHHVVPCIWKLNS